MLGSIAAALSLPIKVFSLWFLLTALLFWKRPAPYARRAPKTRFACLIPARNEEAVVAALVHSLRAQSYPDALYDVYVIPNNCTDRTAEAARAAGARLLFCAAPVRCKGDALHEAVARLLPRGYDAFCLFDADNLVHPDFLARMNDAMLAGARVAKSSMRVKNPRATWVTGCYALYFALNDTFFNRSRASLGLSAKLVGTGVAVHRAVLERLGGWNTATLAEDAELAAQCAALGERVRWVPEAITYDEAPTSFRLSLTQRRRWCGGVMSVAEAELPKLLRAAPAAGRARSADMCFFLLAPFAQALSSVPALLRVCEAAYSGRLGAWAATLLLTWCGAALFALLLAPERGLWRSAALFPLFMASFLPLQVLSLLRRTSVWQPIPHGAAASRQSRQERRVHLGESA